jgi:hypothetical protein
MWLHLKDTSVLCADCNKWGPGIRSRNNLMRFDERAPQTYGWRSGPLVLENNGSEGRGAVWWSGPGPTNSMHTHSLTHTHTHTITLIHSPNSSSDLSPCQRIRDLSPAQGSGIQDLCWSLTCGTLRRVCYVMRILCFWSISRVLHLVRCRLEAREEEFISSKVLLSVEYRPLKISRYIFSSMNLYTIRYSIEPVNSTHFIRWNSSSLQRICI